MKNAIDFLIDISNNMEGNRKSFAQRLLSEVLMPVVDFSQWVGMKTFMAAGSYPIVIPSLDLAVNSLADFQSKVSGLPMPNQGAPIASAVNESVSSFNKVEASSKQMVLISAGHDDLAGSYLSAVNQAAQQNITFSVVCIGASESDASIARQAASAAGGVACFLPDDVYDSSSVSQTLAPLVALLQGKPVPAAAVAPKVAATAPQPAAQPQPAAPVAEHVTVAPVEIQTDITASPVFQPISVPASQAQPEAPAQPSISNLRQQIADNNSSVNSLLQQTLEAFNTLAAQKEEALATIKQMAEDDANVVIHTDAQAQELISHSSQKMLFAHLQKKYPNRVKWVNAEAPAQKGYDFVVEDTDNNSQEYLIACIGLLDDAATFLLPQSCWQAAVAHSSNYQIYLVRNLQEQPSILVIDNLFSWIAKGKLLPAAAHNIKLPAGNIVLSLVD